MDTPSASPGLFSYLQHQPPAGTTPFHATAKFLRLLGLLTLAYAGIATLETLLNIANASAYVGTDFFGNSMTGPFIMGEIIGLVFTLAIVGAFSFWVSYTYFHWCRRTANGWNHAQYLGITVAILSGIGLLFGLMGLALLSFVFALGGLGAIAAIFILLGLAANAAVFALSLMVLTNRGKSHAAFGLQGPAPMAPMSPQ